MNGWIIETLIATTLLMVLVLLVRGRVAALFGARVAYLLWLLPALRMVLPSLPADLGTPSITPTITNALPAMVDLSLFQDMGTPPTPAEAGIDWMMVALVVWLAGAVLHFGMHLIAYRKFLRFMLREATPLPDMDRDGVEVCSSRQANGPFAAGIFVKTIVLPHDYRSRYDADELRLAMRHELEHHRRCDMSANLAALIMMSLHWFNPIAYRAHRAFRIDQELACDARVLGNAAPGDRHSYASALVKSASRRVPAAVCAIGTKDQLKRRLRMMRDDGMTPGRARTGSAIVTVMLAGGLMLTASGGFAAEATKDMSRQMEEHVTSRVLDSATQDEIRTAAAHEAALPTPPVPPEPPAPPSPPEALAPPAPPAPPHHASQDAAQARREALDAARQARQAAAEARREALAEAREARRLAADARAEAAVSIGGMDVNAIAAQVRGATGCINADSGYGASATVCPGAVDRNAIDRTVLQSLENARDQINRSPGMDSRERARATASLDARIAELRARVEP